jgi:hypothetical protein
MSIRRVLVPVIVALGMAGSILAGSAAPTVAAQGPSAHAIAAAPGSFYHGSMSFYHG